MKKKVLLITVAVLLIFCLSGCFTSKYPVYERMVTKEEGIVVIINDVKYKTLPGPKWKGQKQGEFFGYAGEEKKSVYLSKDDDNRNFIFIYDSALCPKGCEHRILLYREDLPEPSAEFTDEIQWSEYVIAGDETIYSHGNTLSNKKIVAWLFDIWNSDKRIDDATHFSNGNKSYFLTIYCLCNELPSVYYKLELKHYDGRIVLGNNSEGYVEIPIDLVEEIAGHGIDFDEWLS